jgi:3'-phosphoadenosine 5'-phosphosulfate sulfotransferase (PAPS reductase)/FAD synthetase
MACDSSLRKTKWMEHGCNAYDLKRPLSTPMAFWLESDVLEYLKRYEIPYAPVYGDIIEGEDGTLKTTGAKNTGCCFCAFGAHLEKEPNRFQRLKETHPTIWEYCMKPWERGGLGMKKVLEFIGVKIE